MPTLDTAQLRRLARLHLVAPALVHSARAGLHPSQRVGAGIEFAHYRNYVPGDDLRRLDWKRLARSDRYYIREAETDTARSAQLVLDASASMQHAEAGIRKLDYAAWLLAALALILHQQGDALGLTLVADSRVQVLPPRHGSRQLQRVWAKLEQVQARGTWPAPADADWARATPGAHHLTVLASDLHETDHELRSALQRWAALGHQTHVLHLMGARELALDYHGPVALEDLETGAVRELDADAARAAYRSALQAHLDDWYRFCAARRIHYRAARLDVPLSDLLTDWLRKARPQSQRFAG